MKSITLFKLCSAVILGINTGCSGGFGALGLDGSKAQGSGIRGFVSDQTMRTYVDETNSDTLVFHKYLKSYAIPAGVTGVSGFSGYISAVGTNGQGAFDFLFTVGYSPGGNCPANGTVTDQYPQNGLIPDYHELGTFIIKGLNSDSQVEKIDIALPQPIGVSGCIFTVVDGGYVGSGSLHMVADVTLGLIDKVASPGVHIGMGDEFCTGMTAGCELATPAMSAVLASKTMINQAGTILSLYGSISEQATQTVGPSWTDANDFYLDKGCIHFPGATTFYGPGDYATMMSDAVTSGTAVRMMQVPFGNPSGNVAVMQSTLVQPVSVHAAVGDCLVHVLTVNNPYAPVSSESQVQGVLLPDGNTSTQTGLSQSPASSIARFFNGSNGDHLYSVDLSEVAGNAAWMSEGYKFALAGASGPGVATLYRCLAAGTGHHLLSTDANCEGQAHDATLGQIYLTPYIGTVPLYRFYLPSTGDHLFSTVLAEGLSAGYYLEAVTGWVVPLDGATPATPGTPAVPVATAPAANTGSVSNPATPAVASNPLETVYRFFSTTNGDHLVTTRYNEVSTGYTYEGAFFSVYQNGGADLVPVYRCYASGMHFLSRDSNCEGQIVDAFFGYIDASPVAGTNALHRYWNTNNGSFLETTNAAEATSGWVDQGIIGYAH